MTAGAHHSPGPSDPALQQRLESLCGRLPAGRVPVSFLVGAIGREGYLLCVVLLALPFLVPLSIPGLSTVFGAVIALIGISLIRDRPPWLPRSLLRRSFPTGTLCSVLERALVWVHRVERLSRPRLALVQSSLLARRINGLMLVFGALLLMAPLGFLPFSNALPGLAVLLLAIGLLRQDGVCILLGWLANGATVAYFALVAITGTAVLRQMLAHVRG